MDPDARIRGTVAALADAWNAHDAAAYAALFHEDADFTNVFGMTASGRDGVERFHAPLFATIFRNTRFRADAVRARFVRPEVAVLDIRWTMTGAEGRDRKPWPERTGIMSVVMTLADDTWAIAVMHVIEITREHL